MAKHTGAPVLDHVRDEQEQEKTPSTHPHLSFPPSPPPSPFFSPSTSFASSFAPTFSPFILHPSPFTLHPSPFTLHPSPCTFTPTLTKAPQTKKCLFVSDVGTGTNHKSRKHMVWFDFGSQPQMTTNNNNNNKRVERERAIEDLTLAF